MYSFSGYIPTKETNMPIIKSKISILIVRSLNYYIDSCKYDKDSHNAPIFNKKIIKLLDFKSLLYAPTDLSWHTKRDKEATK